MATHGKAAAGRVVPPRRGRTVAEAGDAFLARPMAAQTRRSYTQTIFGLRADHGDCPLAELNDELLESCLNRHWDSAAPATWNRHVATARSFTAYCQAKGWLGADPAGGLERRREPADRTKAIAYATLERLWRREDAGVRERCLWRLLYETAARAEEILSRNVEDVDLDNKRIRVTSKGGDTEWLHFQSGAARLLPKIIGGRPSGPLFLADRRPSPARVPAAGDICPHTGRGRLSYQRAAYLFKTHSQKVTKTSATLHQLRHSALTHLAEANVGLPLLMAKSRHTSLRSLQRYARPGADAVAAMTATHDPAARRRGSDPR